MMRHFTALCIVSLLLLACSNSSNTQLITGTGLNQTQQIMSNKRSIFTAGERFAVLLKNIQLKDSHVDLVVHSIDKKGIQRVVRTFNFTNMSTNFNYIQIPEYFSIPLPGKFKISFIQLGKELGSTVITIKEKQ